MSKTALLFAGQGAQVVGMGKDLAAQFPAAKAWFDRLSQQCPRSDAARRIPVVTVPAASPPGPAPEDRR